MRIQERDAERDLHRVQQPVIRAVLLLALALPARAMTTPGSLGNQSVVSSTSGVIGSVSLGNSNGKTAVFVSSCVTTAAVGSQVVLSSRTTTQGKTFYLQHFDISAFISAASTSTVPNMGSFAIFTPNAVKVASNTFAFSGGPPVPWKMEFAEAVPIASNVTFASSVTANTATSITWCSNFWGNEK